jgi:predicted component of type VI protein secretion system
MQSADFVLAVRARMPQEQLRKQLLQQTKVASSDKIRDAVNTRPLVNYPGNDLSRQLAMVSSMIRSGLHTST